MHFGIWWRHKIIYRHTNFHTLYVIKSANEILSLITIFHIDFFIIYMSKLPLPPKGIEIVSYQTTAVLWHPGPVSRICVNQ